MEIKQVFRAGELLIKNIEYHRNGICGRGFFAIAFEYKIGECPTRNMIATVFETQTEDKISYDYYSVLDADLAANGNINFGENSWMGDRFIDDLIIAIKVYEAELERTINATTN